MELPETLSGQLALLLAMGKKGLVIAAVRYLLLAGPMFALCYILLGRVLRPRHIQGRFPSTAQIFREIGWSLSTSSIFAAIDVAVILLSLNGIMRMRILEPSPPLLEFVGSVVLLLILHDAYFYWAHRFLHWGPVFRIAHKTHHRSLSPTPFAAFAFHPIEAVIQYGFVPILAFVLPIHAMPYFAFGILMTALNAYGHLGIELMPRGFARRGLRRYLLTQTHHDLHHSTVRYNFGFYSNVWDRLMGTNHPGYADELDRAASGRPAFDAAGAHARNTIDSTAPGC